ncbi:uncharacterized protein N7515_007748 [Penicillium bovifimosum]|uniref:Uncharacterized protein n=1 Tax=Penicillium bovifimosum TaxID=126998 RepID=A0A9W9KX68_9EURO|nr:uncharacterized protein N7515_007748 [Penicillium bovifimosum]KAJ5123923.1 hypothetical protein N7515_007748 [Penicillium bovifimosum]
MSNPLTFVVVDSDRSESESDGGMQLDADLDNVDGDPMESSDGDSLEGESIPVPRWAPLRDRIPTPHAQNPHDSVFARPQQDELTAWEEAARARATFSDEKFGALSVLKSSELLMTYALANKETIPQTRRRFMAKYLEPDYPEKAEELYSPRIYIAPDGKGGEGSLISGRVKEYIGDVEEHGWRKPGHLRAAEARRVRGLPVEKSGSVSGSASGSRSGSRVASPGRRSSGRGVGLERRGERSVSGSPFGVGVDEDEDL